MDSVARQFQRKLRAHAGLVGSLRRTRAVMRSMKGALTRATDALLDVATLEDTPLHGPLTDTAIYLKAYFTHMMQGAEAFFEYTHLLGAGDPSSASGFLRAFQNRGTQPTADYAQLAQSYAAFEVQRAANLKYALMAASKAITLTAAKGLETSSLVTNKAWREFQPSSVAAPSVTKLGFLFGGAEAAAGVVAPVMGTCQAFDGKLFSDGLSGAQNFVLHNKRRRRPQAVSPSRPPSPQGPAAASGRHRSHSSPQHEKRAPSRRRPHSRRASQRASSTGHYESRSPSSLASHATLSYDRVHSKTVSLVTPAWSAASRSRSPSMGASKEVPAPRPGDGRYTSHGRLPDHAHTHNSAAIPPYPPQLLSDRARSILNSPPRNVHVGDFQHYTPQEIAVHHGDDEVEPGK